MALRKLQPGEYYLEAEIESVATIAFERAFGGDFANAPGSVRRYYRDVTSDIMRNRGASSVFERIVEEVIDAPAEKANEEEVAEAPEANDSEVDSQAGPGK